MKSLRPNLSALAAALVLVGAVGTLSACRGMPSSKPPIHPNPNMDNVARYDPQEPSRFFDDGRAMRPPVPGTLAYKSRPDDTTEYQHLMRGYRGDTPAEGEEPAEGQYFDTLPPGIALDDELLAEGRERYGIFCAPCHGPAGYGDGIIVEYGIVPPTSYHDDRIRGASLGRLFYVITNGVRTMQPYASQISVEDRWAISAYVRALQVSQGTTLDDVPPAIRQEKGWSNR